MKSKYNNILIIIIVIIILIIIFLLFCNNKKEYMLFPTCKIGTQEIYECPFL